MDSLNQISSAMPQFENERIRAEELEIGRAYNVMKIKQTQTRFGKCTYAIIRVADTEGTVNRVIFLPNRLNQAFTDSVLETFNAVPDAKYLKYLGSKKMYEGARPTHLFEFGDL